jgi:hypothetical protein
MLAGGLSALPQEDIHQAIEKATHNYKNSTKWDAPLMEASHFQNYRQKVVRTQC